MSNFIEKNNEKNITKCFILYVDKEAKPNEKETVCNFSCEHCYYRFSNQKFKTLQEMINEINLMLLKGANHVQITGAEPTIHKDIIPLIDYIKSKNVLCSVITNGYMIAIDSVCKKYVGKVDYFLMSVHGYKQTWGKISGVKNAWEHTIKALENCKKHGIEVHFNTTILKQNYKELGHIINLAIDYNVKRCNFICFNPFCSFKTAVGQKEVEKLMVSYDDMMPFLEEAFDLCVVNNIDFAMRYFPFCKVPTHMRKYNYNYSTLMFDWNEWNYKYWFPREFIRDYPILEKLIKQKGLEGSREQQDLHAFGRFFPDFRSNFTEQPNCVFCNDYLICDTPHTEQVLLFKNQEYKKTNPPFKKNAKHYINGGD